MSEERRVKLSIVALLEKTRQLRGLSPDELGGLVGIDGGTIRAWERGDSKPTHVQIEKLCTKLNVTRKRIVTPMLESLPTYEQVRKARPLVWGLKNRRKEMGLSQEEVAERLRVPAATLRSWEEHRTKPGNSTYRRWCRALGTTPEEQMPAFLRNFKPSLNAPNESDDEGNRGSPHIS